VHTESGPFPESWFERCRSLPPSAEFRIGPEEQVAQRLAHPVGEPAPAAMFVAVMQHVAALAEGLEVATAVIAGVVVEVGGSQEHFGRERRCLPRRVCRQGRN